MPQLIRAIDEIAREKQRDVIFVQFHNFATGFVGDYRKNSSRGVIIKWLDENDIWHCPCGGFDSGSIVDGYGGELYVDVTIDHNDSSFIRLLDLFSDEEGGQIFDDAWLFYFPLAVALVNSIDHGVDDADDLSLVA